MSEFSSAEQKVVDLVITGLSNKEVAAQLYVGEKTIKFHLTNIYRKMKVKDRYALADKLRAFPPLSGL